MAPLHQSKGEKDVKNTEYFFSHLDDLEKNLVQKKEQAFDTLKIWIPEIASDKLSVR